MAHVIPIRRNGKAAARMNAGEPRGPAEIIIFPGVRYERTPPDRTDAAAGGGSSQRRQRRR